MLDDLKQLDDLAKKYDTCPQDVLFIALNALGLNNDPTESSRMRFYARLHDRPEKEFRFILSTGRDQSPFSRGDEKGHALSGVDTGSSLGGTADWLKVSPSGSDLGKAVHHVRFGNPPASKNAYHSPDGE